MRIVSDFRDYYDGMQYIAQDRSMLYLRKQSKVKQDKYLPSYRSSRGENTDELRQEKRYIGFCGKIYPLLWISYRQNDSQYEHYCYSVEEVDKVWEHRILENRGYHSNWSALSRVNLVDWFQVKKDDRLFLEYKVPIFYVCYFEPLYKEERVNCLLNARLESREFYRVMDMCTAFQELTMYLGSTLAENQQEMPKIDDKTMAEIKGFDKYSFRKAPRK